MPFAEIKCLKHNLPIKNTELEVREFRFQFGYLTAANGQVMSLDWTFMALSQHWEEIDP